MEEITLGDTSSRIIQGLNSSIKTPYRKLSVVSLSIFIFLLFAFTTDIPWHLQTLEGGVNYWDNAIYNSVISIYLGGLISSMLTISYSLIAGATLTNVFIQLKSNRISGKGLGSILPGFVATGCASCGVGLASFVGLTGVAATLPFQGNLFKLGGLLLLFYALYDIGDPDVCEVNAE